MWLEIGIGVVGLLAITAAVYRYAKGDGGIVEIVLGVLGGVGVVFSLLKGSRGKNEEIKKLDEKDEKLKEQQETLEKANEKLKKDMEIEDKKDMSQEEILKHLNNKETGDNEE